MQGRVQQIDTFHDHGSGDFLRKRAKPGLIGRPPVRNTKMIKSAFAPVVAASIALLLGHAAVAGSEEVREAPKALRGVWKARSVSKDQGKTEDQIRPMTVATVSANKVKHPTGSTVNLDKVVVVRENGAGPLSLFKMSDGTVFAVTEKKTPGLFMMQVLGGSPMKETVRFGFAVEK